MPVSHSSNQKPIRVLMVTNLYPYPGYPAYGNAIKAQIDSLAPEGVEPDVLFINGRESKLNYLRSPFDLWLQLRSKPYDLVHAHFGLAGLIARLQQRYPLVVSLIGDDVLGQPDAYGRNSPLGHFYQDSSRWLARRADAVIVMSEQMRRRVEWPEAIVMGNGVDLELFCPMDRDDCCRKLGLDPKKKYVLFPYDPIRPHKHFALVEEAVRRAGQQLPQLEILPVFHALQTELAVWMNAADVLVLASYSEGSPNAVKEAMSVNLLIVSVRVGDVPEMFDGVEGCHLCASSPLALAEKIVEVCSAPRRSGGRERVSGLSMERVARRLANIYRRLLGRPELDEEAAPPSSGRGLPGSR